MEETCCERRGEYSLQSILPQWENFQEEEVNTSPLERKTKQDAGVPEPPECLGWDNAFFCLLLCQRSALYTARTVQWEVETCHPLSHRRHLPHHFPMCLYPN